MTEPERIIVCCHHRLKPDMVAIEYHPKWSGKGSPSWRSVKLATAVRHSWCQRILRCAHCMRPAVRIDHHWPYMSGANACEKHLKTGFRD